jgi:hypothetical protein
MDKCFKCPIILTLHKTFNTPSQNSGVGVDDSNAHLVPNCVLDVFEENVPNRAVLMHVGKQSLVK